MAKLTIRVGASVDRSLSVAFAPLIDAAKKAQTAISAESKRSARSVSTETKKGTDASEAAFRQLAKEMETGMAHASSSAASSVKKFASESKASFEATKRSFGDLVRETESSMRRVEKAQRTPSASLASRAYGAIGGTQALKNGGAWVGQGVLDLGSMALNQGVGLAKMLAGAAGVRDPSQLMSDNVSLETMASQLSNSAYMPGQKGPNGQRQDPNELIAQIRDAAIKTGTSSVDTGAGLQAFVGKTGDLQTGRDLMTNVNRLSKATGSSDADMFDAAGDIANSLGDTDDKARKVYEVLKMISAQGKEGAVEIKDLASQMAKLGAAAGSFSGDRSHVLAEMSALTQMSRAKGGSASATQAATSTLAFTNTFDKGAREKAFKAFGVDTRNASGMLLDPKQIIMQALSQASSDQHGGMANFSTNMGQMFSDTRARSATRGFETVFKESGGGDAGLQAVSDAFDKLAQSVMTEAEVTDSFNASMQTSASKAQQFNEEWAKSLSEFQVNMLPALQAIAPAIIDATKLIAEATKFLNKSGADDAGRGADTSAENARTMLKRDLFDKGGTSEEHMAAAEKALANLDTQLKEKRGKHDGSAQDELAAEAAGKNERGA